MTRKTVRGGLPVLAGVALLVAPNALMAQVVVQPGPTPSVHFGRVHFGNTPTGGVHVRGVNIGGVNLRGINAGGINAGLAQIGGRSIPRRVFSGYRFFPPPYGIYEFYPSVYGNPYTATPYDPYAEVPANLYPYSAGSGTAGAAPTYGLSRDELDILMAPGVEVTSRAGGGTLPPE
ncbi:MAG: hypothetical protein U0793_31675 [Gemmataceae bacterium]